jgi:hypothetical protein
MHEIPNDLSAKSRRRAVDLATQTQHARWSVKDPSLSARR